MHKTALGTSLCLKQLHFYEKYEWQRFSFHQELFLAPFEKLKGSFLNIKWVFFI